MKKCILVLLIVSLSSSSYCQDGSLSIGYLKTELGKNAVGLGIEYAKKLQPRLELFKPGHRSLLSFTPDLSILTGSDDAFNGVVAKYTGNILVFDTTSISGIPGIPDLSKTFHNFPVSAGIETNQNFTFINGLLEIGYIPWYQNNKNLHFIWRHTKAGIFLQGGYKSALNDSISFEGGATDESSEKTDHALLRAKAVIGFSPVFYFNQTKQLGCSLIGNATAWFDFLHGKVYYKLQGKVRVILTKDYALDMGFEKGSGAPNFNQGEQFTTQLTIRF